MTEKTKLQKTRKIRKYFPTWTLSVFALTLFCAALYLLFRTNRAASEFFNRNISFVFRFVFAKLGGLIPFSVVEFLILFSPVILVYVIIYSSRAAKRGTVYTVRMTAGCLAVACAVFCSFVLLYAPGYFSTPLAEKMSLDTSDITAEELAYTMDSITDEINLLLEDDDFVRAESGATLMPYSLNETAEKICKAYDSVNDKYSLFRNMTTRVKPIILSPLMTYTHISGVYSFYTGEVNINTNYPDYVVVSTVAHELAHQRGIAPEDEASFAAYLALISSGDPYLMYSGYLDVYTYISDALYKTDTALWKNCRARLCGKAASELEAYSVFFEKYRDSSASKVSDSVNNAFLQSQGTAGTVSYDLVTELVASYTARGGGK